MEIRKLKNPWSDDIMALVQALPLCWSVEDEKHVKPVDLVRNNDFENPEIGVTYRKDLFVNVTHWRYTSQVDQYRKAFSDDLAAARRACFPPELAAPYKPENVIEGGYGAIAKDIDFATAEKRIYAAIEAGLPLYHGRAQIGQRQGVEVINNVAKALEPVKEALGKLSERFDQEVRENEARKMGFGKLGGHPNFLNAVSKSRYAKKGGNDGEN